MIDNATTFVDDLSTVALEHVFNPYSDRCDVHDLPDAAKRRRRNLKLNITAALKLGVPTIWIARDLGYLGGRRTGLALTDEAHLEAYSRLFGGLHVERATKARGGAEKTAKVIWDMIDRLEEPVFLWNAFPLHPHEAGKPMSNRRHTARESDVGAQFLRRIVSMIKPKRILAIGADAYTATCALGVQTDKVRHPSFGGKNTFIRQIEKAYRINSITAHSMRRESS